MQQNKSKHIMTVEEAITTTADLFQKGVAPFMIASALLSDNFSHQQTETIMRWAYLKVKHQILQQTELPDSTA